MARNQTEFRLHCMVAELLRWAAYPEIVWFHVPNGGRSFDENSKAKRLGVRRGVSDLIILCRGKAIAIELKPEKGGRQKPEQKVFALAWEAAGGDYYLLKGYEAVVEKLEWLRIIRPVKGNTRFEPRTHAA